ncbi:HutP family protein [Selenomonadales bacterium OttesenSCG-928-I06]|nr:HutP family protein [Selenomonadales bacterium OttesenSCG-928-I06]
MNKTSSIDIGRAALRMAITSSRQEEEVISKEYLKENVITAAVDFGGDFTSSIRKIIERTVVAAQRQNLVPTSHIGEGAVAGAAKSAIEQIFAKAAGFNVGGKIGIARQGEHICVALYFGVGLLHLNEVTVGIGHRSIPFNNSSEKNL